VSSQCFGERPDGGQTDDVTYGHAPAGGVTNLTVGFFDTLNLTVQ
jgi:hypothetical protein